MPVEQVSLDPTHATGVVLRVLVLRAPRELLAAVMGFLTRDPVTAAGMGILSGEQL